MCALPWAAMTRAWRPKPIPRIPPISSILSCAEGETTFREMLHALESENRYERILGLFFREQAGFDTIPIAR